LNRNATASLRKIVNKTHPADLARAFHSLSHAQQTTLFNLIDDREKQGMLMTKIDTDELQAIVESTDKEVFISILEQIPPDDVADLVGRLPEEIGQRILEGLNKESSEEIGELLQYDDQSAGGIMVPEFIALPEETTAKAAISYIQKEHHNVEMTFYLYVVDDYNKLVGVCSLRELVTIAPETPLSGFMTTDLHFVYVDSDQEQVARIVARYDLLAVPVIDHDRKLLGIVTVDDVIDIIRDEATEDILKMVGAGESFVETKSIFKSIKIRLPWLFASCMGGVLATVIIGHFESTLEQLVFLAAFIPVIMGMGGNVGTQSLTIVVRGLATDRIQLQNMGRVILKEIAIVYGELGNLDTAFEILDQAAEEYPGSIGQLRTDHSADPLKADPPRCEKLAYLRLPGPSGYRSRYAEASIEEIARHCARSPADLTLCVFCNIDRFVNATSARALVKKARR